MGPNQNPANRSTRQGKFATGCGVTGMPTACGIPPLQGWEEVKAVVTPGPTTPVNNETPAPATTVASR